MYPNYTIGMIFVWRKVGLTKNEKLSWNLKLNLGLYVIFIFTNDYWITKKYYLSNVFLICRFRHRDLYQEIAQCLNYNHMQFGRPILKLLELWSGNQIHKVDLWPLQLGQCHPYAIRSWPLYWTVTMCNLEVFAQTLPKCFRNQIY